MLDKLNNLVNYYHENKLSHAYLIETNDLDKCLDDLKIVVKKLFCPNVYEEQCIKCNICNLIDQNYLPSLKIIEPNGSSIKKEQILELKRMFSSIPIYTKNNIYIIKNAEKMTDSSANTMLKFLEEPEDNLLGFFITKNINNVINTIKSRCEIIKAYYAEDDLNFKNLFNDKYRKYFEVISNYIYKIEIEKKNLIMYNKNELLSNFSEREDYKLLFKIMLLIYEEALNYVLGLKSDISSYEQFAYLINYGSNLLIKRIKLITEFLDDINYNVNIELLLDKFVIELSDVL